MSDYGHMMRETVPDFYRSFCTASCVAFWIVPTIQARQITILQGIGGINIGSRSCLVSLDVAIFKCGWKYHDEVIIVLISAEL